MLSILVVLACLLASSVQAETIDVEHHFQRGMVPIATLQGPNTSGGLIAGVGMGSWQKHPLHRGLGSWVYPESETTEPLITLTGADWHLRDFSLYGCKPDGKVPAMLPRVGILIKFQPGVGTGGMVIERMNFQHLESAIQFGDGVDSMCDTTNVRKIGVKDVDYVVNQTIAMSMENTFDAITASKIRRAVFRIQDGGNNSFRDCTLATVSPAEGVNQAAFLSIGQPGCNNWTYTVANAKLDKQCGINACLVDMDKPLGGTVTVIGSHVIARGYGEGKHLWNLHDAVRITIIGGSGLLTKHSINVKRDWPKFNPPTIVAINVEDCASPEEMVAPGSAPVYIQCIGCGTQQSNLPGRRMMRFSFNNLVDRSQDAE